MVSVWALRFIREAMFWNISNNLEDVVRVLVGSLNITREEKYGDAEDTNINKPLKRQELHRECQYIWVKRVTYRRLTLCLEDFELCIHP